MMHFHRKSQDKAALTSSVFCNRDKLSRPFFQQKEKLAAFLALKAPRAFFLSPSNESILDPTLLAYYVSRLKPIRHVVDLHVL
jgi:hypothetical protein